MIELLLIEIQMRMQLQLARTAQRIMQDYAAGKAQASIMRAEANMAKLSQSEK